MTEWYEKSPVYDRAFGWSAIRSHVGGTVKIDIFCISPCSPNGPSRPRRFCGVQVFSPEAKTLEQWWLCRPEH